MALVHCIGEGLVHAVGQANGEIDLAIDEMLGHPNPDHFRIEGGAVPGHANAKILEPRRSRAREKACRKDAVRLDLIGQRSVVEHLCSRI